MKAFSVNIKKEELSQEQVYKMLQVLHKEIMWLSQITLRESQTYIKTFNGNFLKTEIDTICIHGDNNNAVDMAKSIKKGLISQGVDLKNLDNLSKFK